MDNKTEAKAEAMMNDHMTGMCPMDPGSLLDAIAMHEQNEAALYCALAQCAPTPCLQRTIAMMAAQEANQAAALAAIAAAYGIGAAMPFMPGDPPPVQLPPFMPPNFYAAGDKQEK
ncbi:hypothetical protein ACOBQJ_16175 [Pelotomaculum propionicicum]|uniref:hypothetical protein n=1 Tax=Pelotomaculum propionicicum TaxID=258475 RepID=UPI003B8289A8